MQGNAPDGDAVAMRQHLILQDNAKKANRTVARC
jgi:hypothetical protein